MGQRRYGRFGLKDNRDMMREITEEVLDAQVYAMRQLLALDNHEVRVTFKEEGGDDEPGKRNCEVKEAFGCCGGKACGESDSGGVYCGDEGYEVRGMLVTEKDGDSVDSVEDRPDGGEADEIVEGACQHDYARWDDSTMTCTVCGAYWPTESL